MAAGCRKQLLLLFLSLIATLEGPVATTGLAVCQTDGEEPVHYLLGREK